MYHVGKISATKKCNHPSVSDRFQASRMDMASLLAAQQLLAGSGGASLSASQQQQLVGNCWEIKTFVYQEFLIFSAATNEQQFAAVVSNSAAAIARQVLFAQKIALELHLFGHGFELRGFYTQPMQI